MLSLLEVGSIPVQGTRIPQATRCSQKKKKKVKICCLKLPGSFKQEYFDHKKNAETILFYKALFTSLLHLISLVKAHVKTKFLSVLVMLLNKNYKEKHFLSNSLCFKYPV